MSYELETGFQPTENASGLLKIFPIITSPESQLIIHSLPAELQLTRTGSCGSKGNPRRGSYTV